MPTDMPSISEGRNPVRNILVTHLGRSRYREAWDLQRAVFTLRARGRIPDTLLLTEHEHVYTLGTSSDDNHLLAEREELRAAGIEVCRTDRGGDVTYHGPGQLVGYPIIGLDDSYHDVHRYLRDLEEVIIRTLEFFGIRAAREPLYTGVWVGGEKVAAIGIKVSRWTTMHGFALNVSTDLRYFSRIIPCGIFHRGVTSLDTLTGSRNDPGRVSDILAGKFAEVFDARIRICSFAELQSIITVSQNEPEECLETVKH